MRQRPSSTTRPASSRRSPIHSSTPTTILSGGVDQFFVRGNRSLLTDGIGSTVALADPTGAVTGTYTYEPFGRTTATGDGTTNPYRFAGREDDGAGLYNYRARFYDPGTARFVSEDPTLFASGDSNFYAYAYNSPTNLVDPLGLEPGGDSEVDYQSQPRT